MAVTLDFSKVRSLNQPVEEGNRSAVAAPPPYRPDHEGQTANTDSRKDAFEDFTGSSYKTAYRVAHDFHARHHPPFVDAAYWQTHTPGIDDTPEGEHAYWSAVHDDVTRIYDSAGRFCQVLLLDVYNELETEYQERRVAAARKENQQTVMQL